MKIFIFALLCFSTASFAASFEKLLLGDGCQLFDFEGTNKHILPGNNCLFFNDGSLISIGKNNVKLISKVNKVEWTLEGHLPNFQYGYQEIS